MRQNFTGLTQPPCDSHVLTWAEIHTKVLTRHDRYKAPEGLKDVGNFPLINVAHDGGALMVGARVDGSEMRLRDPVLIVPLRVPLNDGIFHPDDF